MTHPLVRLGALGQSPWYDFITRDLVRSGELARLIREDGLLGMTSNPTIFEHAIGHGSFYDEAIARLARRGKPAEELFFTLALDDLTRAADLFRPIFDATEGLDGWVSLEVSPVLSDNATKTIQAASSLHEAADRPNLFIKIPGTPAGAQAIEESIFNGVPVNVTLLFSREQYVVSAEAYMRGIERRLQAGLDPNVRSVASLFVSRCRSYWRPSYPSSSPFRDGACSRSCCSACCRSRSIRCWARVWHSRADADWKVLVPRLRVGKGLPARQEALSMLQIGLEGILQPDGDFPQWSDLAFARLKRALTSLGELDGEVEEGFSRLASFCCCVPLAAADKNGAEAEGLWSRLVQAQAARQDALGASLRLLTMMMLAETFWLGESEAPVTQEV